eukprot:ANDGO_07121.mRNA.1 Coiled-coil domain-containing protein 40 homolog
MDRNQPSSPTGSDSSDVPFAFLPERIQKTVEVQLSTELDRIEQELREKTTELQRMTTSKDTVGAELYGVQQQLAKLQENLENLHQEHSAAIRFREEVESQAREAQSRYETQKGERDEQQRKLERYQSELDRIAETLVQVEKYNAEMASQIAVKRRETYKAEQDVSALEKEKKTQDILIDGLHEQIKNQQNTLATLQAQLDAQRNETNAARKALSEASNEMATIHFDRKVLMGQWKSSLVGMQRRDEAFRATEDAIRKQREQVVSLESELVGLDRSIAKEQERNGQLVQVSRKLHAEQEFVEGQIAKIKESSTEMSSKHSMLHRSLESTDAEVGRLDQEARRLQQELSKTQRSIELKTSSLRGLQSQIEEAANDESALKKGSDSLMRQVSKIQKQVRDREMELAQVQNEIARIRMDSITLHAHNDSLEDALREYESELAQRAASVDKFEVEVRRRNDEVERKQRELDKLNRRYEALVARMQEVGEEADTGPLEATIKNMGRQIEGLEREIDDAQRLWLRAQTDLVQLLNRLSEMSEAVQTLRAEQNVLLHKRTRLENEHESHKENVKVLAKDMDRMHLDMVRLNEELSRNAKTQSAIADVNFQMEGTLEAKLGELENESIRLRSQIEQIRSDKKQIMDSLIEAERSIMLWEKKISLSKETAEALDPTVGQDDISKMKKEIHIMQVRYEQLQRDQKLLVDDMEQLIYKREMIATKGRASLAVKQTQSSKSGASAAATRASLQRDVALRASELEKEKSNAAKYDQQIRQAYVQQQDLAAQASALASDVDRERETLADAEQQVHRLGLDKYALIEQKASVLRLIQKYQDIKESKYQCQISPDALDSELAKAQDKNQKIKTMLQRLRVECPEVGLQIDKIISTM